MKVVGKLLIWLAVVAVTHISLLLLLMPAAVLYVVELVLLSHGANIFTHKTLSGSYRVKNKYLEKLLEDKGINNEKTWKDISAAEGSVAGLTALSEERKRSIQDRA